MSDLIIGGGDHRFAWHDHWARVPDAQAGAPGNARTHGVCVARDGTVVVFAQCPDGILHFDPDGGLIGQFGGQDWTLAHGLTYVADDTGEYLWLTNEPDGGKVAKTTLTGEIVRDIEPISLTQPDTRANGYKPTWAAENPATGEVWVADGYGQSTVYRIGADGQPDLTLTGEEGAGRFKCPHGIAFDTRGGKAPELYVTDRGNHRIVVYDAAGEYRRTIRHDAMRAPCCFDFLGDLMLVPDLNASVCVYDGSDEIVAPDLGVNREACRWGEGWPNWNITSRPEMIRPGRFNSPHGGCFGPDGSIYIVEWILGGRITKLTPA